MPPFYFVNVTLHVLAAMLWLGGMFFLAAVGAPVLRTVEPAELRQRLFDALGIGFRRVGWIAVAVLIVTGAINLQYRGYLSAAGLGSAEFWRTPFGRTLAVKLAAVLVMIVIGIVHDFRLGPLAGDAKPGSEEALRYRRQAAILARWTAFFGLIVLVAAVRLARGG